MSRPDSMGFAPFIECKESAWKSEQGQRIFVEMVQEKLIIQFHSEPPIPIVEPTEELKNILQSALVGDESETLKKIPACVRQAASYAAVMLTGRARMRRRMEKMKNNIGSTLPLRGIDETDRSNDIFGKNVRNAQGYYKKYIEFEKSFA